MPSFPTHQKEAVIIGRQILFTTTVGAVSLKMRSTCMPGKTVLLSIASLLLIFIYCIVTLRELAEMVQNASPKEQSQLLHRNAVLAFSIVYPDKAGNNVMQSVGTVDLKRAGPDDRKTLEDIKLQIGDYLDVALRL